MSRKEIFFYLVYFLVLCIGLYNAYMWRTTQEKYLLLLKQHNKTQTEYLGILIKYDTLQKQHLSLQNEFIDLGKKQVTLLKSVK